MSRASSDAAGGHARPVGQPRRHGCDTRRRVSIRDDPIAREPESQNASGAQAYEIQSLYEMTHNLFVTAGYKPSGTRAQNVNTIDEVPDSSWFTNRIGAQRRPYADAIARGPIAGAPPDPSHWVFIGEKTSGVHPGFSARDARGETWFIELDPRTNPEGATAAVDDRDEVLLGLRLQPGGDVPDHVRSEARDDRPEGHGASALRRENAVHVGRSARDPRNGRAQSPTGPIASSPAA